MYTDIHNAIFREGAYRIFDGQTAQVYANVTISGRGTILVGAYYKKKAIIGVFAKYCEYKFIHYVNIV